MGTPRGQVLLLIVMTALLVMPSQAAAVADARRAGMGGVLMPGRDLPAANPAWHGLEVPYATTSLPLPLGIFAGAFADTRGQDDLEATFTRVKAAYPFFEVELAPEPDFVQDVEIVVRQDYLTIDLGKDNFRIPDDGVRTDFVSTMGIISVSPGPFFFGFSTIAFSHGGFDLGDNLRTALFEAKPFDPATSYEAFGSFSGTLALALETGACIPLARWEPWEGQGILQAGVGVKGLLGFGYADTRFDGQLVTGDPIFNENDPLDVTYRADLRFNESPGLGYGFDLGLAAIHGPWIAGLSVENLLGRMRWTTEHRLEELTPDGETLSTLLATGEIITAELPVLAVANAGWVSPKWMVAADVQSQQGQVSTHGGVERRLGVLAARAGLSWSEHGGVQGAMGAGIGVSRWSLDLSVRTHPYLYSEGRGVFLGASIGLPI